MGLEGFPNIMTNCCFFLGTSPSSLQIVTKVQNFVTISIFFEMCSEPITPTPYLQDVMKYSVYHGMR